MQQPFKAAIAKVTWMHSAAVGQRGARSSSIAASHAGMSASRSFAAITVSDGLRQHRHPQLREPQVYGACVQANVRVVGVPAFANGFDDLHRIGRWHRILADIGLSRSTGFRQRKSSAVEYPDGVQGCRRGAGAHVRLAESKFHQRQGRKTDRHQSVHIGKRPIFASGNSDGDFEMLEWTTSGEGPRFGLILHHTDADREYAYGRESHVGRLDKALDQAR